MLGGSGETRSGWVKMSKSSPRTSATSVMPASSAVRMASAVGAETAMMTGAPIAAVFCTISTETRRGDDDRAGRAVDAGPGQRADQLVERIVAADILARQHDALAGQVEAGGVHRAGLGMQRLHFDSSLTERTISPADKRKLSTHRRRRRCASPPRSTRCRTARSRPARRAAAAAPRSACSPGPSARSGCRCRRRAPRPRSPRSRRARR